MCLNYSDCAQSAGRKEPYKDLLYMPLVKREVCKMCGNEIIPEKMGVIACENCLPKCIKKIDWKSQEERNSYEREKAQKERELKLPGSRICPKCNEFKPESSSWVCSRKDRLIVCRSCNHELNLLEKGHRMEADFDKMFIPFLSIKYKVDGKELRRARNALQIGMRGVAKLCKWTIQYQNSLECGNVTEISEEAMEKLLHAFEALKLIPDYDAEIQELKKKQARAKMDFAKKKGYGDSNLNRPH